MQEIVKLQRDVDAVLVPFGNVLQLNKDTEVTITQSLGGSYTIVSAGSMYRIDSKDADALGKATTDFTATENEALSLKDRIWNVLRTCYDPEIPVNIVDLGLVYDVKISDNNDVVVYLTLTAPGCGMGPIIAQDAKQKIVRFPEVCSAEVEFVFDPAWDRSMMSDQAKLELGLF